MTNALNLVDLQSLIADGIADAVPGVVRVKAEVASMQYARNGHCYLELCQSDEKGRQLAKIKAIIWSWNLGFVTSVFKKETGSDLAAGMQVLVEAEVNYSALYGVSLYVNGIEPEFTLGAAELQRQQTIERLTKEGLMQKQKGLELAKLPYRLAVISSPTAAGYGDFTKHLEENEYGFSFAVDLFEASMQGVEAPASIIGAIQEAESAEKGYDAILILRGGGSTLDLSFADDYDLAFTIANCSVPVFTAIGHDRDFHVADMVAYSYVKTPTALADIFIDAFAEEDAALTALSDRIKYALKAHIQRMESALEILRLRIAAANPNNILSKGYALVVGPDGTVIHGVSGLKEGDEIRLRFADGQIKAKVYGKF